ncbi:MAG: hypothetical protein WEB87_06810, partial [Bacteriovoracaceae bacterium]
ELLCSRKLFQASNDLAVLKQIQACKVPAPSSINPNVPKELDQIVLKSLAKDRSQRYENMDKFNRALVKFLYSNYPDFNATDLGYFAKQLFKEEITKDKEKFVEYGKIDIKPYLEDLAKDSNGNGASPDVGERTSLTKKIELDFGLENQSPEELTQFTSGLELDGGGTKTNFKSPVGGSAAARKAKAPGAGSTIRKKVRRGGGASAKTSSTTRVRRRKADSSNKSAVRKRSAAKKVEAKKSSSGLYLFVACLVLAVFAYTQPKMLSDLTGINIAQIFGGDDSGYASSSRNVATVDHSQIKNSNSSQGEVRFSNLDSKMRIYINGRQASAKGIKALVPLNKKFHVTIRKSGYKKYDFEQPFYLTREKPNVSLSIPQLEKEEVGLLSTSQNFTSGSKLIIEVDGEKIERDLPFNNMRIPAGQYEGVIANPLLGSERKVIFEIQENKRLFLE